MMSVKKIGTIIFGCASLIAIGYAVYKYSQGGDIGFNEIISICMLIMMFLSGLTWGKKPEDDGFLQEEELGQKITEKSSKIGYLILTVLILFVTGIERAITGDNSIYLIVVLGLAMITLPLVEFFISRKYI